MVYTLLWFSWFILYSGFHSLYFTLIKSIFVFLKKHSDLCGHFCMILLYVVFKASVSFTAPPSICNTQAPGGGGMHDESQRD